ncbi:MAG: hypothetical protein LBG12_13125 [Synergistaceae bacterium]|jgi:hypothetical protein|nr:hypothetical protein [Synergistaceae bacterium]
MSLSYGKKCRSAAVIVLVLLLSAFILCGVSEGKTKKAKLPPYRPSGVIPGTDLKYERLFVGDDGTVSIIIVNPQNTGVSFVSNFSFYNSKNVYLTGFVVEGFSRANGRETYTLELDDLKAYKKAAAMKVLGRSGRMGRTIEKEDGEEDEGDGE